jgi:hypothetical protein
VSPRVSQGTPARGGHVVDLALLFAELLSAPGVTQADLGRRYRKSPGYVSVVCRLGRALREMPPEARDDLRVPHFTLKAAQALVSRHADPATLRAAAARLAASPPVAVRGGVPSLDARARARQGAPGQWDRAPDRPDPIDPLPEPPDAMSRRSAFVFAWDPDAARRDPRAVLAEFEVFVRAATDEVVRRLRHTAGDLGPVSPNPPVLPGAVPAGPALRPSYGAGVSLPRGGDPGGAGTEGATPARDGFPEAASPGAAHVQHAEDGAVAGAGPFAGGLDDTTLRRLDARVAETLRAHRARMDAFLIDRERGRGAGAAPATGRGGSLAPLGVDPADLDADLA